MGVTYLEPAPGLRVPTSEFAFTFVRSSGPGGQNVNKVSSKAVLRWAAAESTSLPAEVRARLLKAYASRLTIEGELIVTSQRYRDQGRNVEDCLEKLGAMIAKVAVPPKRRRATKPSRGSIKRRLEDKRRTGEKKAERRRRPMSD
jgi:ribosome-associated protein